MTLRTLILTVLGLCVALGAPPAVQAQAAPVPQVDVQRFLPSGSYRSFVVAWDGASMPARGFGFELTFNLARRPLQMVTSELEPSSEVIGLLFAGHIHAGYAIADWVELDVTMAFMQFAKTGVGLDALGAGSGDNRLFSLGDLWLEGRFTPLKQGKHGINLGIAPFVTFPTGNPNILLTSGVPTLGAKVALGRSWERFRIGGHLGYRLKPGFAGLGVNFAADDEVFYSVGVGVSPLVGKIDVFAELAGAGVVGPGVDELEGQPGQATAHSPLELLVSGRFQITDKIALQVGGGPGLTAGVGSPEGRVFVGLSYSPPRDRDGDGILDGSDECPDVPEDVDGFEDADGCPDLDNDADGIADGDDTCPDDPEDTDGFEDSDGCPDPDNDSDGILDTVDDCPFEAEDFDGWEDADGCPELDNDEDGIPDTEDDCPMSTEDFDGWEDADGCPEDDNDGDGLMDFEDLCPDRAEVFNGFKDEDGCPDDVIAVVSEGKIVILQRILFKFGKDRILKRSWPVLEAVAQRLSENPQIRKVRVEGHTDSKGSAGKNRLLSKKRARAVVKALVKAGVEPSRLAYEGFGERVPIADNGSKDGRRRNRRVEFMIVEQDDQVEQRGFERSDGD
jgi:outer membrane protein OmpA-like peptidoglycan-associated protein